MNSGFSVPSGRYRSAPNAHLPSVPRMEFPTRRSIRIMTSVSILLRVMGAAMAVSLVNGLGMSALHRPHVGDGARDRCRRRACWAREMGPRTRSLTADEVAVGRGNRPLAGRDSFTIGSETHRTTRFTPFKPGFSKKPVEPFGNRIAFDRLRARYHPGADAGRDLAAAHDFGRRPQIAQPAIGAGTDKDPMDRCAGDRRTW